jgi:hypothetical protein
MAKKKVNKKGKKGITLVRKVLDNYVDVIGDEEMLVADGFDEAIIGITFGYGDQVVVYDWDKCIEILRKDMTHEDALEHMSYNVTGAYVGERTPQFVRFMDSIEEEYGPR